MKKNYILLVGLSVITLVGFAQKQSSIEKNIAIEKKNQNNKATCDTMFQTLDNWGGAVVFSAINGGYVGGHNGYSDKQKAQQFLNSFQYGIKITGTVLWFGGKKNNSGNPNSKITVHAYNMNGTGTSSTGSVPCPNTKIANADLLISAVDTNQGNWNVVTFPSPVFVGGDFAVGISLVGSSPGDTVGLVASNDGGALYSDFSWEQWSDNNWYTPFEPNNWALNIDWAIFPIYCEVEAGTLENVEFTKGIKFSSYPNPTNNFVSIDYHLQYGGETTIEIRDLTGRSIVMQNEGTKSSGKYLSNIDISNLSSGSYLVSVKSGNGMMVQNLTISK